ncbi:MAG: FAD-dependent oxidoreductase [Chloroflexota bacterium]|nr:FAD-dependent oxidoreductase [Chloroflexota bacterium]
MITPDVLRTVPLFAELTETDLQAIATAGADVRLVTDEWLVREGEPPAFYVLVEGEIEVTKTVAGIERVINHYHPGDSFGEVPLLLGSTVVANLRAMTDIRVLRLDASHFHELLRVSEQVAAAIMRAMAWRVAHLQQISIEAPVETTRVIGRRSDLDCYNLREFLSRNHLGFRWLEPDDPAAAPLIQAGGGVDRYPVVVLANGEVLSRPSRRDVANRLGLQTAPRQASYDVAIVGGGPAGLAAAVYGASEGLRTLMIERDGPGGQAGASSRIENYLGFPSGLSGEELSTRALQQATRFGTEIVVARDVTALQPGLADQVVVLDGEEVVKARTVIIATGVSWRSLAVPGAAALVGRGIYYGAARTEAPSVRGKEVYLIGGGNSAGQAALFFASYAQQVTLLVRGPSVSSSMSHYLIDQLGTKRNIHIRLQAAVVAVDGRGHLEAITIEDGATGAKERHETDALFVFIGADAVTAWLPREIARDDRGYILTGLDARTSGAWGFARDPYLLETSIPGVFAVGDVRHGSIKRVASGVGEGSMAIAVVHQYLALSAPAARVGAVS